MIKPIFGKKSKNSGALGNGENPYPLILVGIEGAEDTMKDYIYNWVYIDQIKYAKLLNELAKVNVPREETPGVGGYEVEFTKNKETRFWELHLLWEDEPVFRMEHEKAISIIPVVIAEFARVVERIVDPDSRLVVDIKLALKEAFPEVFDLFFNTKGSNTVDVVGAEAVQRFSRELALYRESKDGSKPKNLFRRIWGETDA